MWAGRPPDIIGVHITGANLRSMAQITALNVYPVKSCRGVPLDSARITATGFEHDREWMIVKPDGRFITQREEPRLALIETALTGDGLQLRAAGQDALLVPFAAAEAQVEVTIWRDQCAAFDVGAAAAEWLSAFLHQPLRLVRFDARRQRRSDTQWTRGAEALNQFSDAFPWLLISQASLDDLNSRLPTPLPMNRFRPNIVIDGVAPYAEDTAAEIVMGRVILQSR